MVIADDFADLDDYIQGVDPESPLEEEEVNLLYVAVTRAREELHLSEPLARLMILSCTYELLHLEETLPSDHNGEGWRCERCFRQKGEQYGDKCLMMKMRGLLICRDCARTDYPDVLKLMLGDDGGQQSSSCNII